MCRKSNKHVHGHNIHTLGKKERQATFTLNVEETNDMILLNILKKIFLKTRIISRSSDHKMRRECFGNRLIVGYPYD